MVEIIKNEVTFEKGDNCIIARRVVEESFDGGELIRQIIEAKEVLELKTKQAVGLSKQIERMEEIKGFAEELENKRIEEQKKFVEENSVVEEQNGSEGQKD